MSIFQSVVAIFSVLGIYVTIIFVVFWISGKMFSGPEALGTIIPSGMISFVLGTILSILTLSYMF